LAVLLGGAVVAGGVAYRFFVRRPSAPVAPDPHAEALKSKLAESRVVVEDREEFEAAETTVDQAESIPPDLGDRRAAVHERGRQMADQMRKGSTAAE
jgi:hypothetical protein